MHNTDWLFYQNRGQTRSLYGCADTVFPSYPMSTACWFSNGTWPNRQI